MEQKKKTSRKEKGKKIKNSKKQERKRFLARREILTEVAMGVDLLLRKFKSAKASKKANKQHSMNACQVIRQFASTLKRELWRSLRLVAPPASDLATTGCRHQDEARDAKPVSFFLSFFINPAKTSWAMATISNGWSSVLAKDKVNL